MSFLDENSSKKKRKLDPGENLTRSKSQICGFDWKTCCFICGQRAYVKNKGDVSFVQTSINETCTMYSTLMKAAHKINDLEMIARLSSVNGDLVAVDARYHRKKCCYVKYIKVLEDADDNYSVIDTQILNQIMISIREKFHSDIESDGKVFNMQALKQSFLEIAAQHTNEEITNRQFMGILEKHWPEVRVIKRGKGLSPLVCSSKIELEDSINRIYNMESSFKESITDVLTNDEVTECEDDNVILHKAATIIRRRLSSLKKLDKEYYSPEEVSVNGQKSFVDKTLLKFVGWLKDQSALDDASDIDTDKKTLSICCDLMSYATSVSSPKHLGLAIHLHHKYGSRKLIDEMYQLGYTISYTELRQFLTSAAEHVSNKQQKTQSGSLVPSNVLPYQNTFPLLIAAGDNWDHNEATCNGKNTTHAMTSMLIVPKSRFCNNDGRIPKIVDRKLSIDKAVGSGGLSAVLHYDKPSARPRPMLSPPPRLKHDIRLFEPQKAKILKLKDLMYNCAKLGMFVDDKFCGTWSTFHSLAMNDVLQERSHFVYNPILMAQPTHYDTVYTTIKRCKEQMSALSQDFCPIVFDMGLLTKALEILWSRPDEFPGVHLMEGGMHFLMSVLAGIGYVYGDVGLKSLLSESDVFAVKTAEHILLGKDFDRGLRAILMVDEVLTSCFLANFRTWCNANHHDVFSDIYFDIHQDEFSSYLSDKVLPLLEEFRTQGRNESPTFALWDDYLQNVSIPFKMYLNASRHAFFDVYEYSRSLFLPFFFASNRTIYARYMPFLVLDMLRLPQTIRQNFHKGQFVTKLTEGKFNSVWYDYCLEVTENKTLKSNGGIIGLTHRDCALGRWFLTRPITATFSTSFNENDTSNNTKHHTDNDSFCQMYNNDIKKMMALFDQTFMDPFNLSDPPHHIVNIATGVSLETEMEQALLTCHIKGLDNLEAFVNERLVVAEGMTMPAKSFYDPLQKVLCLKAKSKSKNSSNDIPMNGEEMYIRLLSMNSFKKVPLHRVMSFENASVPLSIFTDDGQMLSGKKSDFLHQLETLVPGQISNEIQAGYSIIIDGMSIVQMLYPLSTKCVYKDMAMGFWSYILSKSKCASIIHVVFDRYNDISAKSQARMRRCQNSTANRIYKIQENMQIPDWKQALSDINFKAELIKFYSHFLAGVYSELLSENISIIVSGGFGAKTVLVTRDVVSFIPDLMTNQEEADTIMILHAKFAALHSSNTLCILSPDTDVLVLLIHHFNMIGARTIYFLTGRKSTHTNTIRYIPVHDIIAKLTSEQLDIILPLYCLTGCDTVSFFFGIGKKTVYKLLMKNSSDFSVLSDFGNSQNLSRQQISICTKLVGSMYGDSQCKSLNDIRTKKVLQNKHVKPRRLPPTDDSFQLHLQRCLLQVVIWKNALVASYVLPPLTDFGYSIDRQTGSVNASMMTQPVAAPELLSDIVCKCTDMCDDECVCETLQQPCTVACQCEAVFTNLKCCKNIYTAFSCND